MGTALAVAVVLALAACAANPPAPPLHASVGPAEPIEETLAVTFDGPSMALDDDHVFWAARDGAIWRRAKRGGSKPVQLAKVSPPVSLITLDREAVWWLAGGRVQAVSKAGGEVRTLPTRQLHDVWSLARHRDDLVIGVSDPQRMKSTIVRVAAADGAPISETSLDGQAPIVASGTDGVYAGTDAVLVRIRNDGRVDPLSIGTREVPIEVKSIALDRDTVIFSSYCEVRRVSRAGGRTTSLGCKPGEVQQLAIDDTHVYWAVAWPEPPGHGIYRVPKRGGEIELVTLLDEAATAIALDRTHLYWASGATGHIKRRRR
jgi:hypothetical protein